MKKAAPALFDGPDFSLEKRAGMPRARVAGVDEAGRGAWAGPLVAAAVVLDPDTFPHGLDDSKKLSPRKRDVLFDQIMAQADVGIGIASVEEIEVRNVLNATLDAMRAAVHALATPVDVALIDGNRCPLLPCTTEAVIGGDARSLSIAAASIIAKVTRDRIMQSLAQDFPEYGWDANVGYGVPVHKSALEQYGVTPHHRRSYKPIRNILGLAARK